MDINSTYKEKIIDLITTENRPLKAKEIKALLDSKDIWVSYPTLRVTLSLAVKRKILAAVKYPHCPYIYCKPEWVEEGKIKKELEFDPHWPKALNN